MSGGVSRRTVLGSLAVVLPAGLLGLSGCAERQDDLAQQAQGSDQGYVSGSGVISQVPVEKRGAPLELEFTTLEGEKSSLAELRGAPLVINLWYAACPPCRKEAPDLVAVAEDYTDRVAFLGVNVRDQEAAAQGFVETFAVTYPNMLDSDGAMVAALSGVLPPQATPSTVVLDTEGRAAARVVGAVTASTLRGLLDDVLAE